MVKEIIFANMAKRPVRTSVSILAVAIEVTLILIVVGLTMGILTENAERMRGVGADIMFNASPGTVALSFNTSVMPVAIGDLLRDVEGVTAVTPVIMQLNSQDGGIGWVFGIEPETWDLVTGGFTFQEGRFFEGPDEIVIDDLYAASKELAVGDEHSVLNHQFRVSGIVDHGKGARLFIDLEAAQDMTGSEDKATLFYVLCDGPEETESVVAALIETYPEYGTVPMAAIVSMVTNRSIPMLDAFLAVVVGVSVSIGVLVIFLSMYTTITERTREIGILRSLGARKGFVVRLILQETLTFCVVGVIVGIGLSFAIAVAVTSAVPTLNVLITGEWIVRASVLALVSGILGALYPSLRAAGQDPVEALAYE